MFIKQQKKQKKYKKGGHSQATKVQQKVCGFIILKIKNEFSTNKNWGGGENRKYIILRFVFAFFSQFF